MQTAELIVKCHTILEMGEIIFHHILSDLVSNFGKGPKRGLKNYFWTYFMPREGLIGSTKIKF